MNRTKTFKDLGKAVIHADYLLQVENLMFKLEIDLESLPNDPDFESPKEEKNHANICKTN